jgi:hypothetical protein
VIVLAKNEALEASVLKAFSTKYSSWFFCSPGRHRVFNTTTSCRLARCSKESIQQREVPFADLAEEMLNRKLRPHQIGSAFLCYFLLQRQKKVEYLGKQKKGENNIMSHFKK